MNNKQCLNCKSIIAGHYCIKCGQKTSTHRFSFQHFLLHDVIHGMFHLDMGILFTIKELVTRPGHSIREYIQGKRVKHFNPITAIIILVSITFLITTNMIIDKEKLMDPDPDMIKDEFNFAKKYYKFMILGEIPIYSLASFFIFRKSKLNYSENLVINSYLVIGMLLIGMIFPITTFIYPNIDFLSYALFSTPVFYFIYIYWFYYQFFSFYSYKKYHLVLACLGITLSYLHMELCL